MFSSEHETRIVMSQHPSGGITPSRYDLALHEYVQKQQEQRHQSSNLAIASSINKLIEGSADRISNFVSKFVAVLRAS
jgi:DNA repair protein RadC